MQCFQDACRTTHVLRLEVAMKKLEDEKKKKHKLQIFQKLEQNWQPEKSCLKGRSECFWLTSKTTDNRMNVRLTRLRVRRRSNLDRRNIWFMHAQWSLGFRNAVSERLGSEKQKSGDVWRKKYFLPPKTHFIPVSNQLRLWIIALCFIALSCT